MHDRSLEPELRESASCGLSHIPRKVGGLALSFLVPSPLCSAGVVGVIIRIVFSLVYKCNKVSFNYLREALPPKSSGYLCLNWNI